MNRAVLACLVALVCGGACRRQDLRLARIHVPEMKNRACVERVVGAVSRVPSVRASTVKVDLETRDVSVLYDSLNLSLKNIEFAIADAGFAADDVPANAAAAQKLPPECR